MPYGTIQDVSTSQSIVAKILNVGTVSVYSAYDNNQMKLANISNVKEVENIIFSRISNQNNLRSRHYRDDFSINRQQPEYYSDDEYYELSNDYRSKEDSMRMAVIMVKRNTMSLRIITEKNLLGIMSIILKN